jgi:hypothetical protein
MANAVGELRQKCRPQVIKVIFLGESAPDPGRGQWRFFYKPELTRYDNLFRGIMLGLYGASGAELGFSKVPWLGRFQNDGYWVLDVCERPVNALEPSVRREALMAAAPGAVHRVVEANPSLGVIICKSNIFELMVPLLREAGLCILHDTALPFPLGNWQHEFAAGVRRALSGAQSVDRKGS